MDALRSYHFDVLGIDPTMNITTIKAALMKKVKVLHPDKSQNVNTTSAFHAVQEAWETLRDRNLSAADINYNTSTKAGREATSGGIDELRQKLFQQQDTIEKQGKALRDVYECEQRQDARIHVQLIDVTELRERLHWKDDVIAQQQETIAFLRVAVSNDDNNTAASNDEIAQFKQRMTTLESDPNPLPNHRSLIRYQRDQGIPVAHLPLPRGQNVILRRLPYTLKLRMAAYLWPPISAPLWLGTTPSCNDSVIYTLSRLDTHHKIAHFMLGFPSS